MEIFALLTIVLCVYAAITMIATPFALWKANLCDDLLNFGEVSKRGFFPVLRWRERNSLDVEDIFGFFNPFLRPWNAFFSSAGIL